MPPRTKTRPVLDAADEADALICRLLAAAELALPVARATATLTGNDLAQEAADALYIAIRHAREFGR